MPAVHPYARDDEKRGGEATSDVYEIPVSKVEAQLHGGGKSPKSKC